MNNFLLFAGEHFSGYGGWNDFIGAFPSIVAAGAAVTRKHQWFHIVDLSTMKIRVVGSMGVNGTNEEDYKYKWHVRMVA